MLAKRDVSLWLIGKSADRSLVTVKAGFRSGVDVSRRPFGKRITLKYINRATGNMVVEFIRERINPDRFSA